MWNSTAFSEKRSESRSTHSMQKYQYFEWGSTLNLDGFKIIIFQYIICEPFRSWKEGLVKLDVNLWEIWQKFKCRQSASGPPLGYSIWNTHAPCGKFTPKFPHGECDYQMDWFDVLSNSPLKVTIPPYNILDKSTTKGVEILKVGKTTWNEYCPVECLW